MPHFFRIMSLLCLAVIIKNIYHGFVYNMMNAVKTIEPYCENLDDSSRNLETFSDKNQTEGVLDEIDSDIDLDELAKRYPDVRPGGWYTPPNGNAQQRVAIIVPYRDRQKNLAIFLKYMHPFLMEQQIEYRVVVVEQEGNVHRFNRGKLLNVGFVESRKLGRWQCYISHDVDLLPLDRRIRYQCSTRPWHMSSSVKRSNVTLPNDGFGGVAAVTPEQFMKVNGYPNRYWGWGGEDDDIYKRLQIYYKVSQCKVSMDRCPYVMLTHSPSPPCLERFHLLSERRIKNRVDGLSSLDYVVTNITSHSLYTHIVANIDKSTLTNIELRFVADMLCGDKFL